MPIVEGVLEIYSTAGLEVWLFSKTQDNSKKGKGVDREKKRKVEGLLF
jgi:hypothetical protein